MSRVWIFLPEGFLSVVCARQGDGGPGQPLDPDRVMVRSRNAAHLEALRDRHEALRTSEILETPSADYPARIIVEKDVWARVLADVGAEIDYPNFKAAASRAGGSGSGNPHYRSALRDVWARLLRYQGEAERRRSDPCA